MVDHNQDLLWFLKENHSFFASIPFLLCSSAAQSHCFPFTASQVQAAKFLDQFFDHSIQHLCHAQLSWCTLIQTHSVVDLCRLSPYFTSGMRLTNDSAAHLPTRRLLLGRVCVHVLVAGGEKKSLRDMGKRG